MRPIQKMKPRPVVEFTLERKEQFLALFRENGLLYLSCEKVGVSERTVQDHRKQDPAFGEAYEAAKQTWIDDVLVREALRRATKGTQKPIVGGKFKDEIVAHEQVYSDQLMSLMLKSKRGEFREGAGAGEGGGSGGGVLLVPTAPMSMEDWEAAFSEDAKGQSGGDLDGSPEAEA